MGTVGLFPGGITRPGREAITLVRNLTKSRNYTSSLPQAPPWRVAGSFIPYVPKRLDTTISTPFYFCMTFGLHGKKENTTSAQCIQLLSN
jgi:hypothetical protein